MVTIKTDFHTERNVVLFCFFLRFGPFIFFLFCAVFFFFADLNKNFFLQIDRILFNQKSIFSESSRV